MIQTSFISQNAEICILLYAWKKGIFIHTFCRYNIGSATIKVGLFKIYFGFLLAGFWFANLVALLRFMQVCVWKRVMEINEDLASRCLNLSVICMNLFLGLMCHPEYKQYAIISVFGNKLVAMPVVAIAEAGFQ